LTFAVAPIARRNWTRLIKAMFDPRGVEAS